MSCPVESRVQDQTGILLCRLMEAGTLLRSNENIFLWEVSVHVQMSNTHCELIQSGMKQ